MRFGDKHKLNSDETYGARKGRNTHGALMVYQSNFGLAQLLKRNMAILDSDATGCYDRIPHNLLSLAQQRMGCHKQFCIAHAKTLHNMIHKVLTAHGISSKEFTKMLAGIGQGSSNGPSGWHSVCELIMAAYRQLNPDGCEWANPSKTIEVLVWLAGFVDDVVKCLGFLDHCSWEDALLATQQAYQSWQKLLTATGGSLSLDKSSYTMVFWTLDKRTNEFRTVLKQETQGNVTMQADHRTVIIERKDPHEACKDLGIYLAPDGNMIEQFKACLDRAKRIRTIIASSPITRTEAEVFYHSRCMGWARYFLPVTTFSQQQCQKLQSQLHQALLPKVGFNRHMPLTVVFGPRQYGGIGLFEFYTEQAIEHLRLTVLEIRKDTTAGKLLCIELDSLQLISGYHTPVLTTKRDIRLLLPVTRLTYLWQACSDLDIQFEVFSQWIPHQKVEGDLSIMETVLNNADVKKSYSAKMITIFNQCRMYARVTMMSDLTGTNSTQIDPLILNGTRRCHSSLTWPRVPTPRPNDWKVWKAILHRVFLVNGLTINSLTDIVRPHSPCHTIVVDSTPHLNLQQIFQNLPPFYQQLLGIVQFPVDNGKAIVDKIISDDSLGASDGSCMHSTLASYAVKISPRDAIATSPNPFAMTSVHGVDGAPGHIASLRAESRGAIATILLCLILYKKWPTKFDTVNKLTIYFDNKTVMKRFGIPPLERKDFLCMDYDLWMEIQNLKRLLPFKIRFKWVKAHQDESIDPRDILDLPDPSQLNIQVDAMAGEYRRTMPTHVPTIRFPAGRLWIGVNGVYHHHFPAKAIRMHVHGPALKDYIIKKAGWTTEQFLSIEWETYDIVLKSLPFVQRVNWIKLAHDWQHTGRQKMQFNHEEATWQCPLHCGEQETPMHYCLCTAELAIARKKIHLDTLRDQLESFKTCPSLRRAIIEAIAIYCGLTIDEPYVPSTSPRAQRITNAIQAQHAIGMQHLLKGRVVKVLFDPQLEYANPITSPILPIRPLGGKRGERK